MIALAEQVTLRGGTPLDPLRIQAAVSSTASSPSPACRIEELRDGTCPPDQYLVPGTRAMLEDLRARGLRLYLASGTDDAHHAKRRPPCSMSPATSMAASTAPCDGPRRFLQTHPHASISSTCPGMRGPHYLIGFGDGYVEIEECETASAASRWAWPPTNPYAATPTMEAPRLIGVGADYIIPNYLCRQVLLPMLFVRT